MPPVPVPVPVPVLQAIKAFEDAVSSMQVGGAARAGSWGVGTLNQAGRLHECVAEACSWLQDCWGRGSCMSLWEVWPCARPGCLTCRKHNCSSGSASRLDTPPLVLPDLVGAAAAATAVPVHRHQACGGPWRPP